MFGTVTALSGYAVYRAYETDQVIVDAGGGFRAFGVSLDVGLDSASSRPGFDAGADETWAALLVAARVILPFNESWFATAAELGHGQRRSTVSIRPQMQARSRCPRCRISTTLRESIEWEQNDVEKDLSRSRRCLRSLAWRWARAWPRRVRLPSPGRLTPSLGAP